MDNSSPEPPQPRRRATALERHQQIVNEAARLFDEMGYTNATMDDIARGVGLAKPTLYHYFTSKDDILVAIHEAFIDLLIARHQARVALPLAPDQLLFEAMVDILELMETHRGHVRVFFEHHRSLPEAAQASLRRKRDAYEDSVKETIAAAEASGVFRSTDPSLAALATFGMCNWAYQWYPRGGAVTPQQIATAFWELLVVGIGAPALEGGPARPPAPLTT